ncbi:MAG: hypothetical protein BAJALOKI1v1_40010 [Promethearchaeota archaeon]|nr:MAG: hypothetical protein BAJALOKI1v1_40010 [Candidatus Lokiarchaeota archaeon]
MEMSEEPELPPLPAIGDILDRKDRFIQKVYSVVNCKDCKKEYTREFKKGDYTFKEIENEKCQECEKTTKAMITEIYSEWIDPKKVKDNIIP